MHAIVMAVILLAQVSIATVRESAVSPDAAKTRADLRNVLTASAREKLEQAAPAGAKADIKTARVAVTKAFPGAELSDAELDALAFYVMSEGADLVSLETKKIDEQRDALRAAMKAAGIEPKATATYALKLSGDYAQAPAPLAAGATPAAMQQRYDELVAMGNLNRGRRTKIVDAAELARKKGHDIAMNAIRNLK